jgi:hypothetical protein
MRLGHKSPYTLLKSLIPHHTQRLAAISTACMFLSPQSPDSLWVPPIPLCRGYWLRLPQYKGTMAWNVARLSLADTRKGEAVPLLSRSSGSV